MRRKVFDIEEQLRRKETSWQSPGSAVGSHPGSHGRDDFQSIIREKDSYIEQLKAEKYEFVRNVEREKNRLVTLPKSNSCPSR